MSKSIQETFYDTLQQKLDEYFYFKNASRDTI